MMQMTNNNLKSMEVHSETWGQQLQLALTVNGGDVESATGMDYFMHFLTFGWKVIFALIPPPGIMGGWLCFFSSLFAIGLLTAIVGDLASIFGCLIGLKDTVTAITLVALGTSLPDLFASKAAATQEKYADNAIGNVTGSNSVNVFLGLGLPWVVASIYHVFVNVNLFYFNCFNC
jgi:solute carrier family 8 (sodium/calcium exchanger)